MMKPGPLKRVIPDVRKNGVAILLLWAALICWVAAGSLLPGNAPMVSWLAGLHLSDKMIHAGAYLALAWLPAFAFRNRRTGIYGALSMLILGAILEAGQYASPGRSVESGDAVANASGVLCGALFAQLTAYRRAVAGVGPAPSPAQAEIRAE
jgi:hypothetical protein